MKKEHSELGKYLILIFRYFYFRQFWKPSKIFFAIISYTLLLQELYHWHHPYLKQQQMLKSF
jgi:hypothetical protein